MNMSVDSALNATDHFRPTMQAMATMTRDLYRRGWMPGTSGNLSVGIAGTKDRIAITATGVSKGELGVDDTVLIDLETVRPVSPDSARPSAETAIHAALYRATGCGAVIHVHSPYATAVASMSPPIDTRRTLRLGHFELIKGLGVPDPTSLRVPIFCNWPDVSRIAVDVADYFDDLSTAGALPDSIPPALLISHHGVTVWGVDFAQARDRLECIEALCQLILIGGNNHDDVIEERGGHDDAADHARR